MKDELQFHTLFKTETSVSSDVATKSNLVGAPLLTFICHNGDITNSKNKQKKTKITTCTALSSLTITSHKLNNNQRRPYLSFVVPKLLLVWNIVADVIIQTLQIITTKKDKRNKSSKQTNEHEASRHSHRTLCAIVHVLSLDALQA